jgi:hypothetical protein
MVVRPSYVFSSPVDVVVVTVTLPEEACEMEVTVSPRWKTAPSDLALDSRAEVTLWYPPSGAASVPAKLSRGQRERESRQTVGFGGLADVGVERETYPRSQTTSAKRSRAEVQTRLASSSQVPQRASSRLPSIRQRGASQRQRVWTRRRFRRMWWTARGLRASVERRRGSILSFERWLGREHLIHDRVEERKRSLSQLGARAAAGEGRGPKSDEPFGPKMTDSVGFGT